MFYYNVTPHKNQACDLICESTILITLCHIGHRVTVMLKMCFNIKKNTEEQALTCMLAKNVHEV